MLGQRKEALRPEAPAGRMAAAVIIMAVVAVAPSVRHMPSGGVARKNQNKNRNQKIKEYCPQAGVEIRLSVSRQGTTP